MFSKYLDKRKKKFSLNIKNEIAKVPKNTLIELTNACNHACIFCYNPIMKRKTSNLDFETYEDYIDSCYKEGVEEVGLYSTGEPFMTKNLDQYIQLAKNKGIKRLYISTNGSLATLDKVKRCIEAGLDSIKFSINAGTKETYKTIHGYDDFEKVIKNIKEIYNYKVANKINLDLMSSFVYTDLTYPEIDLFKKNYNFLFNEMIFIPSGNQGGRFIKNREKIISKDKEKELENNLLEKIPNKPCEMIWNRLHLTAEGFMTACCTDYENDLTFKKFTKNDTLFNQFNSKKIKDLRKKHLNNSLDGTICKSCIYNKDFEYNKILPNSFKEKNSLSKKKIESHKQRFKKAII